ncbi:hypothetical protein cgR_0481 [Corynebacterium glutamicum R]|uniref:Uncharacterized protein n=1 Tax=Corynebacterium glutamicum (strain R) TaxID=340322 RepID=A0AB72V851_CORGB|nr:hypothetical protein cgR_0481 [Corynebacterium glutamicum R]
MVTRIFCGFMLAAIKPETKASPICPPPITAIVVMVPTLPLTTPVLQQRGPKTTNYMTIASGPNVMTRPTIPARTMLKPSREVRKAWMMPTIPKVTPTARTATIHLFRRSHSISKPRNTTTPRTTPTIAIMMIANTDILFSCSGSSSTSSTTAICVVSVLSTSTSAKSAFTAVSTSASFSARTTGAGLAATAGTTGNAPVVKLIGSFSSTMRSTMVSSLLGAGRSGVSCLSTSPSTEATSTSSAGSVLGASTTSGSAGASMGTLECLDSAGFSLTAGMEPVSSATDTPPSSMLRRLRRRGASAERPSFAARAISSATVSFSSLIFANSFPGKCYSSPLSILVRITPSRSAHGQISTLSISNARIAASATSAPATI